MSRVLKEMEKRRVRHERLMEVVRAYEANKGYPEQSGIYLSLLLGFAADSDDNTEEVIRTLTRAKDY